MAVSRKFLIILRSGDNSLHQHWLAGEGPDSPRLWDLHLSYYGKQTQPYPQLPDGVRLTFDPGLKWPVLAEVIQRDWHLISTYELIWLPDDDLMADLATINRFFEIASEYHLELAQPALDSRSYVNHAITVRQPFYRLRYTNFVEVMAPCFSRNALQTLAPHFGESQSGWGLDLIFPKLLGFPRRGIAIVDETSIIHTRPAGGPLYTALASSGTTAEDENQALVRRYRVSRAKLVDGAIALAGYYAPVYFAFFEYDPRPPFIDKNVIAGAIRRQKRNLRRTIKRLRRKGTNRA